MITDSYRYLATKQNTRYIFQSDGKQGQIIKIVQFNALEGNRWNLGFGDWKSGKVDDNVLTGNDDVFKVIKTVAAITSDFLIKYPERIVVIDPIDEKRKKLYNLVFQRHFVEIESIYTIIGIKNKQKEVYQAQKYYEAFEISINFEQ
jgi:hypothetical protein